MAVFFYCQGQAQQLPENTKDTITIKKLSASSSIELPQIIPPSPKVSSMTKYGEYPVSLYTGLVDITVPVYTIQVNNIQVPIEFKYHASGIKYDDISMEVGLGWSLVAGGVINYTARGAIDFKYQAFIKEINKIDPTENCSNDDFNGLLEVAKGNNPNSYDNIYNQRDGESDIYTYSFLQYSGQFCVPYSDTGPSVFPAGAVFIPADPLKLVDNSVSIILLDDKGLSYIFKQLEMNDEGTNWD